MADPAVLEPRDAPPVLTRQQAAAYLGLKTPKLLDKLPVKRIRLGPRTIRYRKVDLDAYLERLAQ